ncbi:MAG: hypothetical protein AVDCRST_MAG40-3273, partial [uncultured Gemmatimonadaceae bacterium]
DDCGSDDRRRARGARGVGPRAADAGGALRGRARGDAGVLPGARVAGRRGGGAGRRGARARNAVAHRARRAAAVRLARHGSPGELAAAPVDAAHRPVLVLRALRRGLRGV